MLDSPKVLAKNLGVAYQTAAEYRYKYKRGTLSPALIKRIEAVYSLIK